MISKFVRYIGTGGIAAIVDVSGFHVLLIGGRLSIALAASLSWFVAALVNYHLTSRFVFEQANRGRLLQFLIGAAAGLSINVGVTLICAYLAGIDPTLSKVIGIGTAFVINFFINLLWVFRA